ncbi:MAG: CinA family protein [Candidatus Omnitrophica bacterium]|nr:CinA family protein [Candidatus Omnitrophota bacterium]MCB9747775.1 CinA family protein [Candidatus Omnitrophota bacterium]
MRLEEKVIQYLKNSHQSLSIAESCTGGLLGHRVTNIPGSSVVFKGGIVAYSNAAKTKLLKVPDALITKKGAVSNDVACQMALGVRSLFKTDFGVGITGIAGPEGGTLKKPLGLTYIAVNAKKELICLKCIFPGNRLQVKTQAAAQALRLLLEFLI